MSESPLPRLTVSREEAKEKIRARITEAQRLSNAQYTYEDRLRAYEGWSRYNETLLVSLFGRSSENRDYRTFCKTHQFSIISPLECTKRIRESINSLEEIYARLELYEEYSGPTNTTQDSFGNDVFIIHGRDDGAKEGIARFVIDLELKPIILQEQPDKGNTVIEKLERCSSNVGYAIALVTSDDIGALNQEEDELNPRARQNVVFELGYFMGKLGRERVCLLLKDQVELPSDIGGIVYIYMDSNSGWKAKLHQNIRAVIKEIPDE